MNAAGYATALTSSFGSVSVGGTARTATCAATCTAGAAMACASTTVVSSVGGGRGARTCANTTRDEVVGSDGGALLNPEGVDVEREVACGDDATA